MRKKFIILLSLVAIMSATPVTVFAADLPSPQSSPSAKQSKQILTQAQKDAISAARAVFAASKVSAQDGFARAVADAKAIRDQAIAEAGNDLKAARAAKKNYGNSYWTINRAYMTHLKNAKLVLHRAIASAIDSNKLH
jgi:hypothetical protein